MRAWIVGGLVLATGCAAASVGPIEWEPIPSGAPAPAVASGDPIRVRHVTGVHGSLQQAQDYEGAFLREVSLQLAGKYEAVADPAQPVDVLVRTDCVLRNEFNWTYIASFVTISLFPYLRDIEMSCTAGVLDHLGTPVASFTYRFSGTGAGSFFPTACLLPDSKCGTSEEVRSFVEDKVRTDQVAGLASALGRVYPVLRARIAENADSRAAAAGGSGSLIARSTPEGAKMLVDGAAVGATPATITLPAGVYDVTLRLEDRIGKSERVRIFPGQSVSVEHDFTVRRRGVFGQE